MPQTFNINPPILGARSAIASFYVSVDDQSVEVPANQAHYIVGHMFTANNQSGTDLGQFSIDCGSDTAMSMFKAADMQTLLNNVFI